MTGWLKNWTPVRPAIVGLKEYYHCVRRRARIQTDSARGPIGRWLWAATRSLRPCRDSAGPGVGSLPRSCAAAEECQKRRSADRNREKQIRANWDSAYWSKP